MTTTAPRPWHCDEPTLRAFVDGSVDPVSGASVETHLMTCPECRAVVHRLTPDELLSRGWMGVRAAVEEPTAGVVERLLRRAGLSHETARLLAAVPAMRGAWLLAVFAATLFAVMAAEISDLLGTVFFLVIAPLAPLAGVAASFGGDNDPAHDLVVTSPYPALRLLLLRTIGVVVTAVPVTVVVGLTLSASGYLSIAWLTPAAAVVAVTLALGPFLGYTTSATVVGAVWTAAVVSAARLEELPTLVAPAAQTFFLLIATAGAARVVIHYHSLGQSWRQP